MVKVNTKSFPDWATVNINEIKKGIMKEGGLKTNFEHDILSSDTVYRMEYDFHKMNWKCTAVFQNGFKVS